MLQSSVHRRLSCVCSLRHVVAQVICKDTGTHRLHSLRRALRHLPHLHTLLSAYRSALLRSACSRVSSLRSVYKLVTRSVSSRPPVAIQRKSVVHPNCGTRLSRLHSVVGSNGDIVAHVRTRRGRGCNVGALGINCGHIFNCCVRVSHLCDSRMPPRCVQGRALTGTRQCVARRLGRLRTGILNTQSRTRTLRCRLLYRIERAITSRLMHVRAATATLTDLSILTSFTRITTADGCYHPRISVDNHVRVRGNHRPIIRGLSGTPFIPGSAALSGKRGQITVVANPGVTNGSACVQRATLVMLVTRVNDFMPTSDTAVNVISDVFAHINTSSSLTTNRSAFVIRVDRITSVLQGTASGDLVIFSRVNHNASAFSNVDVTQTILRCITGPTEVKTGALFTARCRRLAIVRRRDSYVGGCGVTIGGHNSSIAFLHHVLHNPTSSDCNVRITGLTNVGSRIMRQTGRVLHSTRDRRRSSPRHMTPIVPSRSGSRLSLVKVYRGPLVRRLGSLSIGILAPVRTVRALCSLTRRTGDCWRTE